MIKVTNKWIELRLVWKEINTEIQIDWMNITSVVIEDCIFNENLQLRRNNIENLTMKNVKFTKWKRLSFEISYSEIKNLSIENCEFDIFWESNSIVENSSITNITYSEKN